MFIAVDLKVVEGLAAAVGRAGGMSEDAVLAGLVRLWHRCWADEIDTLTGDEISGVFAFDVAGPNGSARALAALVAFGFLEPVENLWRVRGASRYLRLKDSRRRAAEDTNKKRWGGRSRAKKKVALERPGAIAQRRSLTESPNTESPSTEEKLSPPARSRVLSDRLVATFLEKRGTAYRFAASVDGPALARLLKLPADDDEIDQRWRRGLDGEYQQEVHTIAQLDSKWNALATPRSTGPPARERDVSTAPRPEGRVQL